MSTLIFYDTLTRNGKGGFSPNTLRTKLALLHKGVPHQTRLLSYPDIATTLQAKGVPPANEEDPVDQYTLPAVEHDGKIIMGSKGIAYYLEDNFPGPPLFPHQSRPLADLMQQHLETSVAGFGLFPILYPSILTTLDERGSEYYKRTRTETFGPEINREPDSDRSEQIWADVPSKARLLGEMLRRNREGPFFLGKERSYADILLVASLEWRRRCKQEIFDRLCEIEPGFREIYDAFGDIMSQVE